MTVHEELIDRIIKMTPEQIEKFLNHPEVIAIMEEQKKKQTAVCKSV